ncbi:MAG: protein-methionine-sulfoxide reductase heme-binding subunit MsrQ [Pseudomonadota bacterium]
MTDRINTFARKVPTWVVYLLYFLPMPVLFYWAATNQLGSDPIQRLEHEYGEIALQLLIIGLAITPLRRFASINLLKFRRAIGLLAFAYVVAHLSVWVALDMALRWGEMWADIWKRPYITIGMAAFVLMIPLAITSNNRSVRKLGAKWRSLHKLVYPIAALGAVHYIMVQKVWELEPILYLVVILALIGLRYLPKRASARVAA